MWQFLACLHCPGFKPGGLTQALGNPVCLEEPDLLEKPGLLEKTWSAGKNLLCLANCNYDTTTFCKLKGSGSTSIA